MTKKRPKYDNETRIELLRNGMQDEFWLMICDVLDENIKDAQEQIDAILEDPAISTLPAEQYKTTLEILKSKKLDRQALKDLPRELMRQMQSSDSEHVENLDPYED